MSQFTLFLFFTTGEGCLYTPKRFMNIVCFPKYATEVKQCTQLYVDKTNVVTCIKNLI